MIGFYSQMKVSVHIGYIETVHINNQTILRFDSLWSKEVPFNIGYPRMFQNIDGDLYAITSPSYVIYILRMGRKTEYKKKRKNKSQGVDYHMLLITP